MFSRQQYLNKECTFEEYFRQFVTPFVKAIVRDSIGMKAILASTDPHMNDIPLQKWDNLHHVVLESTRAMRKETGEGNALSGSVCIAKQAAFMLREEANHGRH